MAENAFPGIFDTLDASGPEELLFDCTPMILIFRPFIGLVTMKIIRQNII